MLIFVTFDYVCGVVLHLDLGFVVVAAWSYFTHWSHIFVSFMWFCPNSQQNIRKTSKTSIFT